MKSTLGVALVLAAAGISAAAEPRGRTDVDVAIDLERTPTLKELIAIEQAFERLFGRDVDLILESNARPRVRAAIEQEGVEILR